MLKILWKVTLNTYCIVPFLLIDLIAAYVAFMFTLAAVVIFPALILFVIRKEVPLHLLPSCFVGLNMEKEAKGESLKTLE